MPKDLIKIPLISLIESLVNSLNVPDDRKTEAKTILKHYFEEHPQNDFADKFSAYFFAGTRPIDEDYLTVIRNIQFFITGEYKEGLIPKNPFKETFESIPDPVFEVSLLSLGILLAGISLYAEYERQRDAQNLLNWKAVQRKFQKSKKRWFGHHVENEEAEEKKEEQSIAQAKAAVEMTLFVRKLVELIEMNQKLFADTYEVRADISTLKLSLIKKTVPPKENFFPSPKKDEEEIELDSPEKEPLNPDLKKEAVSPLKSRLQQFIESLEATKGWQVALHLSKGFMIYGMGYWIVWYAIQLSVEYGTLTPFFDIGLQNLITFVVPLLVTALYLGFKLFHTQHLHRTEENQALRLSLDAIELEKNMKKAKETYYSLESYTLSKEMSKLSKELKKFTLDQQKIIDEREEQVQRLIAKVRGEETFTSQKERSVRGGIMGGIRGLTFACIFAWVAMDFMEKIIGVAGTTPALTIPLIIFALGITLYSSLSHYFEKKNTYAAQQQKIQKFEEKNKLDHFAILAKKVAQQEQYLNNLKAYLEKNHPNSPLILKATSNPVQKFDGRYHQLFGLKFLTIHSDRYFRRQQDEPPGSYKAAFKTVFKKGLGRFLGFVEGLGTGSLMVRIFIGAGGLLLGFAFPGAAPTILMVGIIAAIFGVVIGLLKVYRDHMNNKEARVDRFTDEIHLRYKYLQEENEFLEQQIQYVENAMEPLLSAEHGKGNIVDHTQKPVFGNPLHIQSENHSNSMDFQLDPFPHLHNNDDPNTQNPLNPKDIL